MSKPDGQRPAGPLFGVLVSQVGYDVGAPVTVIVRSTRRDHVADDTALLVAPADTEPAHRGELSYRGERWGSHWWRADVLGVGAGTYTASFDAGGERVTSDSFDVGDDLLWRRSFGLVALDQLERRAVLAKAKVGWMDAGMPWQEANAHASMIVGLADVLALADDLDDASRDRLRAQLVVGCDYLALLQDEAAKLGRPELSGGISHMVPGYEEDVVAQDASKAALAWAMAAIHLPDRADDYRGRARRALDFALANPPADDRGFHRSQRGLADDYHPPAGEQGRATSSSAPTPPSSSPAQATLRVATSPAACSTRSRDGSRARTRRSPACTGPSSSSATATTPSRRGRTRSSTSRSASTPGRPTRTTCSR